MQYDSKVSSLDEKENSLLIEAIACAMSQDKKQEKPTIQKMPFIEEILSGVFRKNIKKYTLYELRDSLTTHAYLCVDDGHVIEEFLWKLSKNKKEFHKYFTKIGKYDYKLEKGPDYIIYNNIKKTLHRFYPENAKNDIYNESQLYMCFDEEKIHCDRDGFHCYGDEDFRSIGLTFAPCYNSDFVVASIINNRFDIIKRLFTEYRGVCHKNHIYVYIDRAMMYGRAEMLEYFSSMIPEADYKYIIQPKEASQHIDILKFLVQKGIELHPSSCNYAVRYGKLDCLKYAYEQGYDLGSSFRYAAENANLEILKWIHSINLEDRTYMHMFKNASDNDNFEMMVWAFSENYTIGNTEYLWEKAIMNGNRRIMDFLNEKICPPPINICAIAIKHNSPQALAWAISNDCEFGDAMMTWKLAISRGDHGILSLLKDKLTLPPVDIYSFAITENSIGGLTWALNNDCKWEDVKVLWEKAIEIGNHGVLDLLKDKCSPPPSNICVLAIDCDNKNSLLWAKKQGFKCDAKVCVHIVKTHKYEILRWVRRIWWCDWDSEVCRTLIQQKDYEWLDWAVRNGCCKCHQHSHE